LIAFAGGPDALIVVIPTAWDFLPAQLPTSGPQPSELEGLRRQLASKGAHHVSFLHTRDRQVANAEEFAKVLRSAKAVFFPGGKPLLLENTYRGTLVEGELKALLDCGGVVAGDSAGAVAIGEFALGWTPKPFGKLADGLALLPHVTVTCHANAARGFVMADEVLKYLSAQPTAIGITMEENTVLILKGSSAEVFGRGSVVILDPTKDRTKPSLRLAAGERHDFAK
jgi:cyanophycinase